MTGVAETPAAAAQVSEHAPEPSEGITKAPVGTSEPPPSKGSDAQAEPAGAAGQTEAPASRSTANLAASASTADFDAPSKEAAPSERAEEAKEVEVEHAEDVPEHKEQTASAAVTPSASAAAAASTAASSADALTEPQEDVPAEPAAARDEMPTATPHEATEGAEAPFSEPASPPDTTEPADAPSAPAPSAPAFASITAAAGNYGLSSEEAERLASQFQGTTLSTAPTFTADDAWDTPSLAIPLSDSADATSEPRRAAEDRARLPEWAAENPWG